MAGNHGKGMMFDGDDHRTLPLRINGGEFSSGGDILGMGYSRIRVPPEMKAKLEADGKKPNAEEIVRLILSKPSVMDAVVHIVQGQGEPEMDPYRRIIPAGKKDIARQLSEMQTQAYAGELLEDLGHFIGTGQWPAVNEMPGTGTIIP
jgi:hypothetical protein